MVTLADGQQKKGVSREIVPVQRPGTLLSLYQKRTRKQRRTMVGACHAWRKKGKNRPGGTIARAGLRPPLIAPRPILLAVASRNRPMRGSRCLRVPNAWHHGSSPHRLFL